MSDYEILIVVLTIIAIVVTLIIEYIKKMTAPGQGCGHLLIKH